MKVYMVIKCSGEYEGYIEETIKCFLIKEKAEKFMDFKVKEFQEKEDEAIELNKHYVKCKKQKCEKCQMLIELWTELIDETRFKIQEMEVEE